ncbi:MAG: hypothetical protein CSA33_03490 [Desulfobulbus propionicus]|nr:MAG: hypothetical protein CSA33_03490 [Desulfobulbus propionicus]
MNRSSLSNSTTNPLKKLPGSRKSCFEELDKPALQPLPDVPYELSYWKKATVHIDYHGEVEGHYYSVLNHLVKKKIETRSTNRVVACFYRDKGVASHRRSAKRGCHTTVREQMPEAPRKYLEWTPERFKRCLFNETIPNRPIALCWVYYSWDGLL